MFRKHFRFRRRLVLGLAFAALAVSAAPAAASVGYFVDGGPAPVSNTTSHQSYAVRSENAQSVSTLTPLQVDGLRLSAMAQRYQQLQPSEAISERSFGVPGPDPSLVPQLAVSTSSGFDWSDAGVGASTAVGAALLLAAAIILMRRRQHTGLTTA